MNTQVRLLDGPFDPAEALRQFGQNLAGVGAVVSFTGLARGTAHDGSAVTALRLESYRAVTLRSMEAIAEAAHARFAITRSLVLHRAGLIAPDEPIVFVATAAPHRRAAFEAADYLMDRLKTEAVFWKCEQGPDGSRWIEPGEADVAAVARWHDAEQD